MNNNKNDNFLLAQRTSETKKELYANIVVNAMLRLLKYASVHTVSICITYLWQQWLPNLGNTTP